jgi:hypothetical protein
MRKSVAMLLVGLASSLGGGSHSAPADAQAIVGGNALELHDFADGAFGLLAVGAPADEDVRIPGLSCLGRPLLNAAGARCVVESAQGVEFK